MSRGPRITEETGLRIKELRLHNPDWTAKRIQLEVNRENEGKGPGLSAIYKKLAEIPKKKDKEKELEEPWMLGVSAEHGIPPEANKDLLNTLKWCKAAGRTFTIREARWVARLRGAVPGERLYARAFAYALREQACKASEEEERIYTADLDAELAFSREGAGEWSYQTAVNVGILSRLTPAMLKELETDQEKLERLELELESLSLKAMRNSASQMVLFDLRLKWYAHAKLPENGDIVFSLWMRHLSNGPKWQDMSQEAKEGIAQRLYEEVAEASKEIEDLSSKSLIWLVSSKSEEWKPSQELFTEVGIDVTKTSEEE